MKKDIRRSHRGVQYVITVSDLTMDQPPARERAWLIEIDLAEAFRCIVRNGPDGPYPWQAEALGIDKNTGAWERYALNAPELVDDALSCARDCAQQVIDAALDDRSNQDFNRAVDDWVERNSRIPVARRPNEALPFA